MADFVAVLRKTIGGLEHNTPEAREKVFAKARNAIDSKLASMDPPPPQVVADRQRKALEDAIVAVRAEYEPPAEDNFEDFLGAFEADGGEGTPAAGEAAPPPPSMEPAATDLAAREPVGEESDGEAASAAPGVGYGADETPPAERDAVLASQDGAAGPAEPLPPHGDAAETGEPTDDKAAAAPAPRPAGVRRRRTGTLAIARISLTASMPELPSASWISASTIFGFELLKRAVAS